MAVSRIQLGEDREYVAKQREDQGLHECEMFGTWSEELEEEDAWDSCTKSLNQHENFIAIHEFSERHLPPKYSNKALVRYIHAFAELTVRLRVKCFSDLRPSGYPFSRYRGLPLKHVGSGWVYRISRGAGLCPCLNCPGSVMSAPWWKLDIFTACHVVYDKKEAQSTDVDFFYDDKNSNAITLHGHDVEDNNHIDDVCILHCATHDRELVRRVSDATDSYERLKWEVQNSLMPLCVVISHPHGNPKKVSVGEIVGKADYDPQKSLMTDYMYLYNTDTCNGSSGAPVLAAVTWKPLGSTGVWPGAGPHSWGRVSGFFSQCGAGAFYVEAELLSKTMLQNDMEKLKIATSSKDITFILLGKTGVGKSSLGNSLLGRKEFQMSSSMHSVTARSEFGTSDINGISIKVVDTMGVWDTRFTNAENTDRILRQLNELMSVCSADNNTFLLVFRFGSRFSREDQDFIFFVKRVFGPDFVRQNCIVVMTHGNNFYEDAENLSFSAWCRDQYGPFRELVEECDHRIVLFDNRTTDKQVRDKQLEELFLFVRTLKAKGLRYTDRDYALNIDTRKKISVELKEPEVTKKVQQEESLILEELRTNRGNDQTLKVLLMRAENLMRYVRKEDEGTSSFPHLVDRVATLRKTVEESFTAHSTVMDRMVKLFMADEEIQIQRDWFNRQMDILATGVKGSLHNLRKNHDFNR